MSMKNPLTLAGIEPATFWFVAQQLNHCATAVPQIPHIVILFFKLHKRIITINVGATARDSCREYFRELNILPLQSQWTLTLVKFVIINKNQFGANSDIQSIKTINKSHFHQPLSILTSYQKGTYYLEITVFICLPDHTRTYLIIWNNLYQL